MSREKISEAQAEDFALAVSSILRRIRATVPTELRDFSWTQKSVLSRLDRDGPATSAELARAEGVTPQSMSTAVAALEQMGLVQRHADPSDGRQLVTKLTVQGKALRERTRAAKESWLTHAFGQLERRELAVLFEASDIMRRMAEMP